MTGVSVFETKEGAISYIDKDKEYIDTVKIEWCEYGCKRTIYRKTIS